jgi:hypothetical protein
MHSIRASALRLAHSGTISLEEMARVVRMSETAAAPQEAPHLVLADAA